ncbi:D-amino acid dehydrogenase [Achromobacter xylosoxidans]|uniref:D-amino acid dehydrogenase n=1 Tax=Alcaligenes xylosoxydans xylosoxydans TaxID=85698 RepID=UPI0022B89A30|nr:D-amino acid dehydrogenase [Achromobacter xylosoxidans]MCZ8389086.1 D-amino acid dehydrogenase [Achromobacter xylosoxidans]
MHTIVIGAGVVGMATAYYLHREGHRVSVVEAGPGPGLVTSRANGAQLSYSFVAPLADPAVLPKLPAWLLGRDTPLRWRPRLDPAQWRWCLDFLRACTRGKSRATTRELLALGLYSRQCVHELVGCERPDFDFSSRGKLLVYQDAAAYGRALAQMDYQATLGCEQRALDRQACLDLEPALADIGASIAGAIYTPTEDAGDCLRLCTELERLLRATPGPVDFHFDTPVTALRGENGRIVALDTPQGELRADNYVLAGGIGAQALARGIGLDLRIYPLKGYSLTYTLTPDSVAPMSSISDIGRKVVYARLGQRLRVAGMVDIGAADAGIDPLRTGSLEADVARFFPRLNPAGSPQPWAGLRPARPDGKPLVGATPWRNLWLNAGHGGLGFTLAAGSARMLVDLMRGRRPAVDPAAFALAA